MNTAIGDRIKKLREAKNETQSDLAKALAVKRETVNQWENGARDLKTLHTVMLANYFNVTTDYLLGRESLDDTTPIESLRAEREALKQELSKLRKAVSDMNKILETL